MNKLYKLTTVYYIGPFIATFFICLFVLLMQFLWKYVDDLVGKGLEWYIIGELLFYASASLIPLALPLAILLSSIMTFGNLAENYELMAFKSAGVPLIKVMEPLIVMVIVISIGAFFISNKIIPKANLKFGNLLWDVRKQKPALDIREGVFYNGIENYTIRIGHKDDNTGEVNDVLIYDHTNRRGNDIVIRADRGIMKTTQDEHWLLLQLENGVRYEDLAPNRKKKQNFPFTRMKFDKYVMRFDLSAFQLTRTSESLFKDHYTMLNIKKLDHYEDSTRKVYEGKQKKMRSYLQPYYSFLKDSAFFQNMPEVDSVKESFLASFPKDNRKNIIQRAINTARATKGVFEVHAGDIDRLKQLITRYKIEWHRKFTLSFACLLLFFIGAPLGAVIRKGGLGMPAVVSVILFLIFHVLSITGEKMARKYVLEPYQGMWMAVVILFPLGILITLLANRDSIILTKEAYIHFFKNIFSFFTRKKSKA